MGEAAGFLARGPAIVIVGRVLETEGRAQRKMVLDVHHRIALGGVLVIALGQQDGRADVHWLSPKLAHQLARKLHPLDVLRVGGDLDWRDHLAGLELDVIAGGRIQMHLLHLAVQISRRFVELLAFPTVHVRPDRVPVGAMKFRVDINQRLHVVIARRQLLHALEGIAEGLGVDHRRLPGLKLADVGAVDRRLLVPPACLQTRLGMVAAAKDDKHAPGDRLGMRRGGKRDFKARTGILSQSA